MLMTEKIHLTAEDGHSFSAYSARPKGDIKGGLVILQEIFGVNHHIRAVVDGFAHEGYAAIAPAVFDRIQPDYEADYEPAAVAAGREVVMALGSEGPLMDIDAAIQAVKPHGQVGVVGYCWGGTFAWLSATRLKPAAAIAYYGGRIPDLLDEKPTCPVMMHFGELDAHIPMDAVEAVRKAFPDIPICTYPARHGFSCDERAEYDADSAKLARERTLEFLQVHVC
ncbi:MAG: dienelactone hydrolase family protein [Pseudomonadota bacterium]